MSNYNDVKQVAENLSDKGKEFVKDGGREAISQGKEEIKQSGQDWLSYVEGHPIQSMIFGVIGYFALKGMLKG